MMSVNVCITEQLLQRCAVEPLKKTFLYKLQLQLQLIPATKKIMVERGHNDQETIKQKAKKQMVYEIFLHNFFNSNLNYADISTSLAPVGPNSFLFKLPCFSIAGGILPQLLLTEDDWQPFNESMHKEFGYKGVPPFPKIPVTDEIFRDLQAYHDYIDESSQWMINIWIELLKEFSPKDKMAADEESDSDKEV